MKPPQPPALRPSGPQLLRCSTLLLLSTLLPQQTQSFSPLGIAAWRPVAPVQRYIASQRLQTLKLSSSDVDGTEQLTKKQIEAQKLSEQAAKALAAAEQAQQRALQLKESPLGELAATAKKFKAEKEAARLRKEAEERAEEATKLALLADQAEKDRGTTTLAQRLAEQSRDAIIAADAAERRAEEAQFGRVVADIEGPPPQLSYKEVASTLSSVRLVPVTGSRTDISRTTNALDDLQQARRLTVWNSVAKQLNTAGFRGGSSADQLLKTTKLGDGEADLKLGVTSFKALQLKNQFSGFLMLTGGVGLILAGSLEKSGFEQTSTGRLVVSFGWFALSINILFGIFAQQTNDWLCKKMFDFDYDNYRERAILCEAAHLLVSHICGLPIEEYRREHVGYPCRDRPTGRCQIYSSRRGDPEVAARGRILGLPPWASLEKDVPGESLLDVVDPDPVRNGYTSKEIDMLGLVLLAGPVAEFLSYGSSTCGAPLFQQFDTCMLMSQQAMSPSAMQQQARWSIIKLVTLLNNNEERLRAVVAGMRREDSIEEIVAAIESTPGADQASS